MTAPAAHRTARAGALAYSDLSVALLVATVGDEAWVAQGSYKPNQGSLLRSRSFVVTGDVTMNGGYAGL
ncbi:MAG: hypothetical protein ACI9EF_002065 [Pseudohongiellaceae bacterium]|jgi:hypothetical protein